MSVEPPAPPENAGLPPGTMGLIRRALRIALLGAVVTALVALAIHKTDLQGASDVLEQARPTFIVAALCLTTLGLVFLAARWRSLMPTDTPIALLPLTAITVSGTLMHYAVPGPVGELIAAGMAARRWDVSIERAFAAGCTRGSWGSRWRGSSPSCSSCAPTCRSRRPTTGCSARRRR